VRVATLAGACKVLGEEGQISMQAHGSRQCRTSVSQHTKMNRDLRETEMHAMELYTVLVADMVILEC